jgi:hypothetical protein
MCAILVRSFVLVQFKFNGWLHARVYIAGERTKAVDWNESSSSVATSDVSVKRKDTICSIRRSGDDGQVCGPHGSCLIDRCICDPFFDGEQCTEETKRDSRCLDNLTKDDTCMNTVGLRLLHKIA